MKADPKEILEEQRRLIFIVNYNIVRRIRESTILDSICFSLAI